MLKSEYAREQVQRRLSGRGPVKLSDLIRDAWVLTDDGDPRWIGAALSSLSSVGEVRYATCDDEHDHGDDCTVESIR